MSAEEISARDAGGNAARAAGDAEEQQQQHDAFEVCVICIDARVRATPVRFDCATTVRFDTVAGVSSVAPYSVV